MRPSNMLVADWASRIYASMLRGRYEVGREKQRKRGSQAMSLDCRTVTGSLSLAAAFNLYGW